MQITKLKSFDAKDSGGLKHPNSAAFYKNGDIVIADGGNNRVIKLDLKGKTLFEHGQKGFEHFNLREPIFVYVNETARETEEKTLISDWHNHRMAVLDKNGKFLDAYFHLGTPNKNIIKNAEYFLKHLLTDQVGETHYFTKNKPRTQRAKYKLSILINGLKYYINNLNEFKNILFSEEYAVRKINGIAVQSDRLIITQKANKLISTYKVNKKTLKPTQHIKNIDQYSDGKKLGRLCNLHIGQSKNIYICDQDNWIIGILDQNARWIQKLEFKQTDKTPMGPFSCVELSPDHLAIARSFGFIIHDLKKHETIYENNDMGETHGIAYHKPTRTLAYVDRSNSRIERFKVAL